MTLTASPEIEGHLLYYRRDPKTDWSLASVPFTFMDLMYLVCIDPKNKPFLQHYSGERSHSFTLGHGGNAAGTRLDQNKKHISSGIIYRAT